MANKEFVIQTDGHGKYIEDGAIYRPIPSMACPPNVYVRIFGKDRFPIGSSLESGFEPHQTVRVQHSGKGYILVYVPDLRELWCRHISGWDPWVVPYFERALAAAEIETATEAIFTAGNFTTLPRRPLATFTVVTDFTRTVTQVTILRSKINVPTAEPE